MPTLSELLDQHRAATEEQTPQAEQTDLPTPQPEERGVLGKTWDAFKHGGSELLSGLDVGGRAVRSLLHGASLGDALDAAFVHPDNAASVQDLKKDWGIGNLADEGSGWTDSIGSFAKHAGDFVVDTGIGIGTDPLSLLGVGEVSKVGQSIVNIGKQASKIQAVEGAAKATKYMEDSLRAAGHSDDIVKSAVSNFTKDPGTYGLADTLAERLRSGQTHTITAGIPFTNIHGALPLATPAFVKAAEVAAPALNALAASSKALGVTRWAGKVRDALSESIGNSALDDAVRLAKYSGEGEANEILRQSGVQHAREKMLKSGWTEDEIQLATTGAELMMPKSNLEAVRGVTGKSIDDVAKSVNHGADTKLGTRSYSFKDHEEAINAMLDNKFGHGPSEARAAASESMTGMINATHKWYEMSQNALKNAGLDVQSLGGAVYQDFSRSNSKLIEAIKTADLGKYSETIDAMLKAGQKPDLMEYIRQHPGLAQDASVKLAAEEWKAAFHAASTVPSYAMLGTTPEAREFILEEVKKDPSMGRAFYNSTKMELSTTKEANDLVQKWGTKATGGRAIEGILSPAEIAKATAGAKGANKTIEQAINDAIAGKGRMFESDPLLKIRQSFDYTAKELTGIRRKEYMLNAFGKDLPEELIKRRAAVVAAEQNLELLKKSPVAWHSGGVEAAEGYAARQTDAAIAENEARDAAQRKTGAEMNVPEDAKSKAIYNDKVKTKRDADIAFKQSERLAEEAGTPIPKIRAEDKRLPHELTKAEYFEKQAQKVADLSGTDIDTVKNMMMQAESGIPGQKFWEQDYYQHINDAIQNRQYIPTRVRTANPEIADRLAQFESINGSARSNLKGAHEDFKFARAQQAKADAVLKQYAERAAETHVFRSKKALEDGMKHQGGILPPGMTIAGDLDAFAGLKGTHLEDIANQKMISTELADMMNKYHKAVTDPATPGMIAKTIQAYGNIWKAAQLSAPSRVLRDGIGRTVMRLASKGYDAESILEMGTMGKLVSALAEPVATGQAKLEALKVHLGNGKYINGVEAARQLSSNGLLDTHALSELTSHIMEATKRKGNVVGNALMKPINAVNKFGGWADQIEKAGMFFTRQRMGDTEAMAAGLADKYLFNYSNVSPGVQWLRSTQVLPFAAWSSKSIPLQLELLFNKPVLFTGLMHAKNSIENGVPGLKEDEIPDYVRERFGVIVKKNKDGSYDTVYGKNLIPLLDVTSAFNPVTLFAEGMGPLPKAVVEGAFNQNLYTKQLSDKYEGQVRGTLFGIPYSPRQAETVKVLGGRFVEPAGQIYDWATGNTDAKTGKAALPWNQNTESLFNPVVVRTVATPYDAIMQEKNASDRVSAAKADVKRFNLLGDTVQMNRARNMQAKFEAELRNARMRTQQLKSERLKVVDN